jgi:hypothetical protein
MKISILEVPLHKAYYLDFIRLEFNSHKDSLIPLSRKNVIGEYIYSIAKPFASDNRRKADVYAQFLLPNHSSSLGFTRRYNYLNYAGETMVNNYLSAIYHLRIVGMILTARQMKIEKKEAIYSYMSREGISLNNMNFDQISKAVYRFDSETKKALGNILYNQSQKRFGT